MQTARVDTPDVHRRSSTNRLESLQDFDIFAGIAGIGFRHRCHRLLPADVNFANSNAPKLAKLTPQWPRSVLEQPRNKLRFLKVAEGREPSGFAPPDGSRALATLGCYLGTVP